MLVITMMYEPDFVGIAAIASDMCAALAERGHDVTVYTTYPYYPDWKLKGKAAWRVKSQTIRDVRVRRHRMYIPSNPSRIFQRLLHEMSFMASLLRSLFFGQRQDVVIAYCPLMGSVFFAGLRKLWFRDPLWINIQDIPVEAASASGILKSRGLSRLASMIQGFGLKRADAWTTISPSMVRQLESVKSEKIPLYLLPNWLTGSLQEQIEKAGRKEQTAAETPTRLLYCGTIGKKQGLLEFCQLLSPSEHDFHLQICGEGGEADAVEQWIRDSGDPRFSFGGLLSQSDFVNAIRDADWFVIPQKSSVGSAFFPSKLIPAIHIGTPIMAITQSAGPLANEVSENGLGLVVSWENVAQIPDAVKELSDSRSGYEALRANCRERAKAYERDHVIDQLESYLLKQFSPSGAEG